MYIYIFIFGFYVCMHRFSGIWDSVNPALYTNSKEDSARARAPTISA